MAQDWLRSVDRLLMRIDGVAPADNFDASPQNRKLIRDFVLFLKAKRAKPATIWRHVYSFSKLIRVFGLDVEILKASKDEIVAAVAGIEDLDVDESTKAKIKVTLKFMFKHFNGDDLYYPREIAWIKTTVRKSRELTESELLTRDDIRLLIDNAKNLRDAAILALMGDAPLRTHEIIALRRKHLTMESNPAYIVVPEGTKTGTRRIPIFSSVPYLATYLNAFKSTKPDDALFLDMGWNNEQRPMTAEALRVMVKKVAKRAGLQKHIFPYLFRHSRITQYTAQGLSNAQLEKIAGWKPGTEMHSTYQHLSQTDIDGAAAKANGIQVPEGKRPKTEILACPRCKFSNSTNMSYCGRCGAMLNITVYDQLESDKERLTRDMAAMLKDKGSRRKLKEAIERLSKQP